MDSNIMAAEVLETAADLYLSEKVEWCQGSWVSTRRPDKPELLSMCAEGALLSAAGFSLQEILTYQQHGNFWLRPEMERLAWARFNAAMEALLLRMDGFVHAWNDSPGRMKQEVIDVFQATAKDLRNGKGESDEPVAE